MLNYMMRSNTAELRGMSYRNRLTLDLILIVGGYFFPLNVTEYYLWLQNKTEPPKNRSLYDLYQSFTNINCATQNKERPQFCGPANIGFLYPYIKVSK